MVVRSVDEAWKYAKEVRCGRSWKKKKGGEMVDNVVDEALEKRNERVLHPLVAYVYYNEDAHIA